MNGELRMNGSAALIATVLFLAMGLFLGRYVWSTRAGLAGHDSSSSLPIRATASNVQPAPPALRCTPGDPPTAWTRLDAEGELQAARMYLATADHYAVPALKSLWIQRAAVSLELVKLCWTGEVPK